MYRLSGLKISDELLLVRLTELPLGSGLLPTFCSKLAVNRINMPFLSTEHSAGGVNVLCCVDAAHQSAVKSLIASEPQFAQQAAFTQGVGLLTLYPHRSSLIFFERSFGALNEKNMRIWGLASSVGALTFILDHNRLDEAAAILRARFELTENHAPMRAEFVVTQGVRSRPDQPE